MTRTAAIVSAYSSIHLVFYITYVLHAVFLSFK